MSWNPKNHQPMTDSSISVVASATSPWQHIEIRTHPKFGHQLYIDSDLQISESDRSYNVAMVSPLIMLGSFGHVAILGGGDGGVLKELLDINREQQRELGRATMIDIDPEVSRLCQRWLPSLCGDAFDDPLSDVIAGDVFAYIEELEQLDGVIYDLTIDPVREDQSRREFLRELMYKVARRLRPGGMLSMQCCGTKPYDELTGIRRSDIMHDIHAALEPHFDQFTEQRVFIPSYNEAWTFLAARRQ